MTWPQAAAAAGGPHRRFKSSYLPPILPLVLYHGEREWSAATELAELFDVQGISRAALEGLRPYLPALKILLEELRRLPGERTGERVVVRMTLLLFKHGRSGDLLELLRDRLDELRLLMSPGDPGLRYLRLLVTYVLTTNDMVSTDALAECLAPLGDDARKIPMSVGDRLIEQGRQEGLQAGLQKGLQKGRQEGLHEGLQKGRQEG